MNRGQSNVVGVALLLGIAVVSMGTLTAAVGVVVESSASEADAERVASDFEAAFEPVSASGAQRGDVAFSEGELRPVDRTLEVRADGDVLERVDVDALVFETQDTRVTYHTGAVVRGSGRGAWMASRPPITVGENSLVIGAAQLGENVGSLSGTGGVTATIATDVAHERRELGEGTFSVAVETAAPGAWERAFERRGATVERERGDVPTVVASFGGERTGYLVVHDLNTEVLGRG